MTILDFILVFILAFTTAAGFFFGLIRVVGAIATIIISIMVAGLFSSQFAAVLKPYLLDNQNFAKVGAFTLIYWFSSLFLHFAVQIVNKIFSLPLLKTVNRLLGAAVSLAGAVIILSIFFYLIESYSWVPQISDFLHQSLMASYLIIIGKFVSFVIPGL